MEILFSADHLDSPSFLHSPAEILVTAHLIFHTDRLILPGHKSASIALSLGEDSEGR